MRCVRGSLSERGVVEEGDGDAAAADALGDVIVDCEDDGVRM